MSWCGTRPWKRLRTTGLGSLRSKVHHLEGEKKRMWEKGQHLKSVVNGKYFQPTRVHLSAEQRKKLKIREGRR